MSLLLMIVNVIKKVCLNFAIFCFNVKNNKKKKKRREIGHFRKIDFKNRRLDLP
jgi:hypothetical protein